MVYHLVRLLAVWSYNISYISYTSILTSPNAPKAMFSK